MAGEDQVTSNVPIDQPVEVVVPPETGEVQVDVKQDESGRLHGPDGKFLPKTQQDEDTALLKQQLEATRQAAQIARQREEQSHYARQQAEQRLRGQQHVTEQAQLDAILNAMGAAQAEAEAAQRDLETSVVAQDARAQAEAQRRLAKAEARFIQLEDGKLAYENRAEQMRMAEQMRQEQAQRQPQQQRQPTPDEYINSLNIPVPEKDWLRAHQDVLSDNAKWVAVQHHSNEAGRKGIQRSTPEFFKYIDEQMGYGRKQVAEKAQQQRQTTFAAPVSQSVPGQEQHPTRVTLSPQQREAAKMSGISEVEYARQFIKMQQAKRDGLLQETR